MILDLEVPPEKPGYRVCGNCNTEKPVEEFYKDGTDSKGNPKYRRDCKPCYRVTRLSSRKKKKVPPPKTMPPRRGKGGKNR